MAWKGKYQINFEILCEMFDISAPSESTIEKCEEEIISYISNSRYLDDSGADITNVMYGKKHTRHTKNLISEKAKGQKRRLGLKHTGRSKEKMSLTRKEKNLRWYNNGIESKMLSEQPEGWSKGRLQGNWGRSGSKK